MPFNPTNSRSFVLKKGKVAEKFHIAIAGALIPTISEQPKKCLGKLTLPLKSTEEEFKVFLLGDGRNDQVRDHRREH